MDIFSDQIKFFEKLQYNLKVNVKLVGNEKTLLAVLDKPGKNAGGYGWFAVREGPLYFLREETL